jgi:regulator of protease activity HflC (stomatin/prohibitin superfamily)
MQEEDLKNENLSSELAGKYPGDELDAAGKSLAEALRISFIVLKIIMVVLGPGPHWVLPYPIDRLVRIPVEKKTNLVIDSFWYFETRDDLLESKAQIKHRLPSSLKPIRDGYCLTRSEKRAAAGDSDDSDYNIVHSKWQLIYQINKPEQFFRNVYIEDVRPGQIYVDVIAESLRPLLQSTVESAVVTALVNYTIDDALVSQERIPAHVAKLLQKKLDNIGSGIKVVSVQLTDITWPRQVDQAFLGLQRAGQESHKAVNDARLYHDKAIIEARGKQQEILAQAGAYRTKTVETAKGRADYLKRILPEYRERPKLVLQRIYLDAIEQIYDDADEKFVVQPASGTRGSETRVLINSDPTLKPKKPANNKAKRKADEEKGQ